MTRTNLPALFETTVKLVEPFFRTACIRFSGMPQRPKPPTNNFEPSSMSATASSIEENTFFGNVEYEHANI